jgi:hypothetical protein
VTKSKKLSARKKKPLLTFGSHDSVSAAARPTSSLSPP